MGIVAPGGRSVDTPLGKPERVGYEKTPCFRRDDPADCENRRMDGDAHKRSAISPSGTPIARGQTMDEILKRLRGIENIEDLASMLDELDNAWAGYTADREKTTGEMDEKIHGLEDAVKERDTQIRDLQAENYKLITMLGEKQKDDGENYRLQGDNNRDDDDAPLDDFIVSRDDEDDKE